MISSLDRGPGSNLSVVTAATREILEALGELPDWIRIHVQKRPGHMNIELLGRLTLALNSVDKTLAWYWRTDAGMLRIRQQPSLTQPLADYNVLALLGQTLDGQSATDPYARKASPRCCAAAMARRIVCNEQLDCWEIQWGRVLRATLGDALELALYSCPTEGRDLSTDHLKRIWRHQDAFLDVRDNAAGLVPLLGLWLSAGYRLQDNESPLGALRRCICEIPGCSPATWRWLQRWGARSLTSLVQGARSKDGGIAHWAALSSLLELWSRAGLPPPLPLTVAELWGRMIPRPSRLLGCCPERLAILAHHLNDTRSSRLEGLESQDVVDCLMRLQDPLPPLDRNQKRAGLAWLRRELQHFSLSVSCEGLDATTNRTVLRSPIVVSGVRFVPLLDAQEIEEEGHRLQHCMGDDPQSFVFSSDLHFSLRCPDTDKSLATCSFSHSHVSNAL